MVINNSIRLKDKNAYVLGGLGLIGSSISKNFYIMVLKLLF